jgi:hypothetical protein
MQGSPKYRWQPVCDAVCKESDPDWLLPMLERAVVALERRSAEWYNEPGTKAEVGAVLESISTLRERLAWYLEQ